MDMNDPLNPVTTVTTTREIVEKLKADIMGATGPFETGAAVSALKQFVDAASTAEIGPIQYDDWPIPNLSGIGPSEFSEYFRFAFHKFCRDHDMSWTQCEGYVDELHMPEGGESGWNQYDHKQVLIGSYEALVAAVELAYPQFFPLPEAQEPGGEPTDINEVVARTRGALGRDVLPATAPADEVAVEEPADDAEEAEHDK
jgi:hypothetical protein